MDDIEELMRARNFVTAMEALSFTLNFKRHLEEGVGREITLEELEMALKDMMLTAAQVIYSQK